MIMRIFAFLALCSLSFSVFSATNYPPTHCNYTNTICYSTTGVSSADTYPYIEPVADLDVTNGNHGGAWIAIEVTVVGTTPQPDPNLPYLCGQLAPVIEQSPYSYNGMSGYKYTYMSVVGCDFTYAYSRSSYGWGHDNLSIM